MKFWKYFVLRSSKHCFSLFLKSNAADMLMGRRGVVFSDSCHVWSAMVAEATPQYFQDCFCDVWSMETPQSHSFLGLQTGHQPCCAAEPGSCNSWTGAEHHLLPGNTACKTDKKAPAWVWQKFPESKIFSWNILSLTYDHESITSSWLVRNHVCSVGSEAHYGSWTILVAFMPVTSGRTGLYQGSKN